MVTEAIEHRAYARVGLLGNPSDVYYGRTVSFSLGNFHASVRLEPSEDLVIKPHPTHDLVVFRSIDHLVNRLENEGYYGGVRLLMAICKVFYHYCADNKIELKTGNFTLSYDTNIPRQTGLSGSSAIVCSALNCLLDFYEVRHLIKVEIRPDMILRAEKELGIVAGLQDRVAQVYGGLVYMDFSKKYMDDWGHGMYAPMDIGLLPPLYLIYAENPSDSGKVHSTVRRRRMFGDDVLGSLNIKMVEVARSVGAACKFTGSGGAVIALCPDGPSQVKLLEDACHKEGFIIQQALVAPTVLSDGDRVTLPSQ
ncbi:Glucuronokinase 1 [Acorus calamus]|uniref:Glucuronokinase 1 n=1 Tax=Acorus calamus TaxID=4465 RepID=A0AAV9EDZ2_ACOCL|nr:Glucuronokinase 1 [Acorus calamus]